MPTIHQALKESRALCSGGEISRALETIRLALCAGPSEPESLDQAGRFILKCLRSPSAREAVGPRRLLSVLLLGQCTTSWLPPSLAAVALSQGLAVDARDGSYDNILQDIAALSDRPDVLVLIPWHKRLLHGEMSRKAIDIEMAYWRQVWRIAGELGVRLVQVGYDWNSPGSMGYGLSARDGSVGLVRQMNDALRAELPKGAFFVDLEQISGELGRSRFYDARSYHWTKQPFSQLGVADLSRHLCAGVRAVTSGPKKVLVLDLDNTLWGGVVGEVGASGIQIGEGPEGEAFAAFQREVRGLSERGIVLAVCSKNNLKDAQEPFTSNALMTLSMSHFAAFEASWDPKPIAIQRLATTLNLGLDSFVFFDDNPAEREHVRQALPEVEVVEVPVDPADYVAALHRALSFESVALTTEDRQRAGHYSAELQRREAQTAAGSVEDYLTSLEMRATVSPVVDSDIERVTQLLSKTNQFNLTTRRHAVDVVRRMVNEPGAFSLTLRLADRFGDHGLVAVVLAVRDSGRSRLSLRLDTWLMSCRTIGRTVEHCMMNLVAAAALKSGYQQIIGEYIPSAKNAQVASLYSSFGFEPTAPPESGSPLVQYSIDLSRFKMLTTFVSVAGGDTAAISAPGAANS